MLDEHPHLKVNDPELAGLLAAEVARRRRTIQLIAAENVSSPMVREAQASALSWKTAEGRPGRRFHSGCEVADEVERLAESRAASAFGARRAWVQPLSGSLANLIAFQAIQRRTQRGVGGLTVLAMGLDQGGHLSHGAPPSMTRDVLGKVHTYDVDPASGLLDLETIAEQAAAVRPDLLICGASSYPRTLDIAAFGAIAAEVGALLLVDMAHISGLVAAGVHPSPVRHAQLVTCSTYKAGGPRGGLLLAGDLADDQLLAEVDRAVFPGVQGTPDLGSVAAKATFFAELSTPAYHGTQRAIVENARHLAEGLRERGHVLAAGGTDTHMVLADVRRGLGLSGADAEVALAEAGVLVNRNLLPFDPSDARTTSAIRLGTNTVTRVGMAAAEMAEVVDVLDAVLRQGPKPAHRERVAELAERFPIAPATVAAPTAVAAAPGVPDVRTTTSTGTRTSRTVFTNGVFDLFHDGHARLLERARAEGDRLIVGVSSDASNAARKRPPLQGWRTRAARVAADPHVDAVLETPWSVDLTEAFYAQHGIDLQVQGDAGSDFGVAEELGILKVIGRTEGISTSKLIAILEAGEGELLAGGALNDVRRVTFEGERFVVKHGSRSVARAFPIPLPDRRTADEYRAITDLRAVAGTADGDRRLTPAMLVEPVWFDGTDLLILRSAPEGAEPLSSLLARGEWPHATLEGVVDALAALHDRTRDDASLRAAHGDNAGFHRIKVEVQCRQATTDPALRERIHAFLETSLRQHARVLLHGDLAPKNVLVWQDRFLLIDFEESGYGDPALDVGYLAAHLLLDGAYGRTGPTPPHEGTGVDSRTEVERRTSELVRRYLVGDALAPSGGRSGSTDPGLASRIARYLGLFLLSRCDSPAPARGLTGQQREQLRVEGAAWFDGARGF